MFTSYPFTSRNDQDVISPYKCRYKIKWTGDQNNEKYSLGDHLLIQYIIFFTNIIRIVAKTVRRVTNEVSAVKESTIEQLSLFAVAMIDSRILR